MNKINIPGFTADASIYKTNANYHSAAKGYSRDELLVVSQISWSGVWSGIKHLASPIGGLVEDGLRCSLATFKAAASCAAMFESGDVGACTDSLSEWPEKCIKE